MTSSRSTAGSANDPESDQKTARFIGTTELPPLPLTKEERDALTVDQVIERFRSGNERFRTHQRHHRDLIVELEKTKAGQSPAAVVLSCIDSRTPVEIIFDLGLGDIFSCRVAGSIENSDILGSMEFATKLSGAKLVLVLGHSSCGAMQGAINNARLGNLTDLLEKIRPAVHATTFDGERTAKNPDFVDAVGRKCVELTIANIRAKSPVIAELEKSNHLKIIGGFYNVGTGVAEFME